MPGIMFPVCSNMATQSHLHTVTQLFCANLGWSVFRQGGGGLAQNGPSLFCVTKVFCQRPLTNIYMIDKFLVISFVYNRPGRPKILGKKHTHFAGGMLFYFSYIKASNLQLLCYKMYFRWKIYQSFEEFCSVEFEITHHKSAFSTKPQPLLNPKNCRFLRCTSCFTKLAKHKNLSIIIVLCTYIALST